jgi:hypothetical protein
MRLFRHRGLHGYRCDVHTKVHSLSILVLYSDTAHQINSGTLLLADPRGSTRYPGPTVDFRIPGN